MAKALVIVDMQKGFITKCSEHVVARIQRLLESGKFQHVFFTKFVNVGGSPYIRLLKWSEMTGPPETDIVEKLQPYVQSFFEKIRYSAFTPSLSRRLRRNKIDEVYIAGVDTNCCVLATAIDAFESGYTPHVLAYYCASHSGKEFHIMALKLLEKFIGREQIIYEEL